MSKLNRYRFASICYKDYVVLLLIKKKLYIYSNNKLVSFYKVNDLKKLHINYIILDNLDIYRKEYEDNRYQEYYLKYKLNNILDMILNKYKEW